MEKSDNKFKIKDFKEWMTSLDSAFAEFIALNISLRL